MSLHPAFLARPIAHRALHDRAAGRPENSRAAIRAAIEHGYGIEFDLQPSVDGVPMVFHDHHLMRLTGADGAVRERTAEELGHLQLKNGDEGIPTLAEVLELVAGRVPLLVEVKDQSHVLGPVEGELEKATAAALRAYEGPVALMSFNPHAVMALRDAAPDMPRGLVTCDFSSADPEWAPAGAAALAGQAHEVGVVEHHRHAVGGGLEVELDAVARLDSGAHGGEPVLGPARPVQPAMGDGPLQERGRKGHRSRNTPSTSTAAPRGSATTPTAERAWLPRSAPSAATISSEAPLTTRGWSKKPGAEATKPVSLTTRRSRSQSPSQAARACANSASAQALAASAPASTSMSAPSVPRITPPASREIWPETCRRFSARTKGT